MKEAKSDCPLCKGKGSLKLYTNRPPQVCTCVVSAKTAVISDKCSKGEKNTKHGLSTWGNKRGRGEIKSKVDNPLEQRIFESRHIYQRWT